ncbi:pectinesterase-like [Prunus avium]|uniref:Pectinesterase n=1 Tax=Prunus avium TaxID=42229 RepID=A0A6P5T655_PRUAV|nr:pectinesterase-like [Prunus avium]
MEKKGKLVIGGVSIVLVVGVVIGLVAVVCTRKSHKDQLSTSSKAVAAICEPTDYKEACINSLSKVAKNESATAKDLIQAAIDSTISTVKSAIDNSGNIAKSFSNLNSTGKMAMDDCKDLLESAIADLQASFSYVGDSDMHTMHDREDELKNWLSAVISFQQSCLDGIPQEELQKQMKDGLLNATQLTSNALAIASSISEILQSFNITLNKDLRNPSSSRRLLEHDNDEQGHYPSWFRAADRRLLASHSNGQVRPNAVVAKDGSGQYKTIGAALAAYPKGIKGRYIIYVKAGIYNEYVTVTKDQVNVFMYGDGPRKTMVTGSKSWADGITTQNTATFAAIGSGFLAKAMGFQNTAGAQKHQAVALRVQSEMSAFFNCRMDAYQDTLYVQTHRQFYRNCVISGTVDFIFGDSPTLIQNCLIIVRKPMDGQQNTVTAQGRQDKRETTGIVLQNCRIVPEQALFPTRFKTKSYLGRPWKTYSRAVIMESELGDFIQPAGWLEWSGNFALDTLYFAEYGNRGPGAVTNGRVRWKGFHVIRNRNEALQFTAGPFLSGDQWLRNTGVPYFTGLKH